MNDSASIPNTGGGLPDYAELRCVSTFSFLVGASQPEELVQRAAQMGYRALALTDECSVAGIVRAHVEAKKADLKLLIGSQFAVTPPVGEGEDHPDEPGPFSLVVLACHLDGYGNLCQFITKLRRASEKGTGVRRWHTKRERTQLLDFVRNRLLITHSLLCNRLGHPQLNLPNPGE